MEKIPEIIHESWHEHLQPLFDDPKMKLIKDEILPSCVFHPAGKDIFRVFQMPIWAIKVVILGQDPYPQAGQATGLAFGVSPQTPIPASLKIIFNEVISSMAYGFDYHPDKTLESWWKQGVFLLNAGLTVEDKIPNSHVNYWSWFTREVVKIISLHGKKPIWMMWGSKAKGYVGFIHSYYKYKDDLEIKSEYNYILECDHPAAETYQDKAPRATKFSGSGHFVKCNLILKSKKQDIIHW